MVLQKTIKVTLLLALCAGVAACGNRRAATTSSVGPLGPDDAITTNRESAPTNYEKSSIWDVFGPNNSEQTANVNRYLWAASLDVLSFLPVQSVDPFTGVIVTGYGTPPGGGRSYRATVHIKDPALEARSLNVALQSKGGPVSAGTTRAVEDAILSRARQLRIADDKL
ncbi:DUF3576 domain-containing protein [Falsiruegeria mediterranea]|jgi:Domain of unknown function (DUF3576)|uniref:DUF3576 domain-containing protein n=1 Tax=Falsiruegeria mediterranea M17 TaxID=1200281 RepID=A0A2R8C2N5_9RHOB|nr:DUF3576 domain-containing protein [Falsiruegeria mediterranea]SPJ26685.1 hypothetical protein TRM7615_00153 [Falsiruegeria mediterranea M17]